MYLCLFASMYLVHKVIHNVVITNTAYIWQSDSDAVLVLPAWLRDALFDCVALLCVGRDRSIELDWVQIY